MIKGERLSRMERRETREGGGREVRSRMEREGDRQVVGQAEDCMLC